MTYDQKQISAVLTVCLICTQAYYMTRQSTICVKCEKKGGK